MRIIQERDGEERPVGFGFYMTQDPKAEAEAAGAGADPANQRGAITQGRLPAACMWLVRSIVRAATTSS